MCGSVFVKAPEGSSLLSEDFDSFLSLIISVHTAYSIQRLVKALIDFELFFHITVTTVN